MPIAIKTRTIGVNKRAIRLLRTVSNAVVPTYSDAEAVTPPCAASAAARTARSAAYAARSIAKNIVAAGLASKCQVQLAYAIGVAHPVSVLVETFGTGTVADTKLEEAVEKVFDLRPTAIIRDLDLRRPIYRQLAAYGHMGREELGVAWHECHSVGTIVHIAVNGEYAGHIVISDVEKPHSRDAIAALKAAGVTKTVMLTGDIQKVADYVARDLGVDEVRAELLPADKVARVEELLKAEPEGAKLAFVGDGINDAPVLSRADIGIAMGAMGSDAAIEAADVVLMDDDPMKIAKAIKISRKCIRIVHENIVFSLGVKLLCLLLVALGFANMWMGIFADVGVMVLAVLNAIRALRVHDL